jgi:uroporphyrinogen decarboxylase
MLSRERVFCAMEHVEADRVPLYIWIFGNPIKDAIAEKYGSVNDFFDHYEIDMVQSFPSGGVLADRSSYGADMTGEASSIGQASDDNCYGGVLTIDQALDTPMSDPADMGIYEPLRNDVEYHKGQKGRAIWVQTPGVFETSAGILGLQGALETLALEPEKMHELFRRIASWASKYADHCIDSGADTIHISDDWGRNDALMFSPKAWWEHVEPTERITVEHVRSRGAYVSLHCDGYFWDVVDGVIDMGVQCVHPIQQSAGMDMSRFKSEFGDRLTIYGGLDVRTTLGSGDLAAIRQEVADRMRQLKPGGGYIFCTSHMVQPGTTLEEVETAYETANEEARY